MSDGYDVQAIEARWQQRWLDEGSYDVDDDDPRPHWYTLCMYPYPSGRAHMGHVRNYTFGDLITRYRTMGGYAVLSPMGFDSFGLPAENAAIKTGRHPRGFTDERIDELTSSIRRIGAVYDWRRQVRSHDPSYIRWTQWIFLRLLEVGLAYRKQAPVNWCPGCQTVLANEQVVDGVCERSGDLVERRDLEQWFFRITDYAQQLLDDLDDLDWPERVKTMQRNWIGRSEGAEFDLVACDADGTAVDGGATVRVFTTRPDTSFGMTYAVMAPEHPLVDALTAPDRRDAVAAFVATARATSDVDRMSSEGSLDKRGVFTGSHLRNPFTGRAVPLYLADYVLMGYGTGAIMAVPAEDQRDWDFAAAHDLPVVRTVEPPPDFDGQAFTGDGPHVNSGFLDGMEKGPAIDAAIAFLEGESGRSTSACATGWSAGSASGAAPSPSCTARPAACSPCPTTSCRCWPPTTSSSGPRASRRCAPTRASCTRRARRATAPPPARPTRWTPSWTRRGTSCASATRGTTMHRSAARRRRRGCRSTSTSAGSSTPSCT